MILFQVDERMKQLGRNLAMGAVVLTLAACAPMEEVDDTTGSRLAQPPAGAPKEKPTDAGDIAIVGQEVAHSIMDLPAVADATVPPLVQFMGVTSIVKPPIDTEPYTELLRDRLLLLTRLKLRFVERTLPAYVPPTKKHKKTEQPQSVQNTDNPDYQILAELRGHGDDEFYRIQVEFVDVHTNEVLFNGLYKINKEGEDQAPPPQPADAGAPPPEPSIPATEQPTTTAPSNTGNGSL
jgi:hypothetical protein